jgi:hypothetical protein
LWGSLLTVKYPAFQPDMACMLWTHVWLRCV